MIEVSWFYEEGEGTPKTGLFHRVSITQNSEMKIDIKIAPDNNVVEFNGTLKRGRVESNIKFSESPPARCQTDFQVIQWIEVNVDQLVQNALVKLLTTAVGFFS